MDPIGHYLEVWELKVGPTVLVCVLACRVYSVFGFMGLSYWFCFRFRGLGVLGS